MEKPSASFRQILEEDFPVGGSDEDKLKFLVQYAILAPSVRSTQPWKFCVSGDSVNLHADVQRALPKTDPEHRELIISCGAALHHFCTAARHFGYEAHVETYPSSDGDLLATMRLGGAVPANELDTIMFYAIHKRISVPAQFRVQRRIPQQLVDDLLNLANAGETWMQFVEGKSSRDTVAGLVAEGDVIQNKDEELRREIIAWTSSASLRSRQLGDGLAGGVNHVAAYFESFLMRSFDRGDAIAKHDHRLAEEAPLIAILGTYDNSPLSWLSAGQTLAAVLLRALAVGVHASFLNQPIEVPDLRKKLTGELGLPGHPQLIFRMGFSDPSARIRSAGEIVREGFF